MVLDREDEHGPGPGSGPGPGPEPVTRDCNTRSTPLLVAVQKGNLSDIKVG